MGDFKLRRLGILMEPEPGYPLEVEGVLNPAAARGPDGELYLFPRLVAKGNYSRIGIARVRFNEAGDPVGVERLGIALVITSANCWLRMVISPSPETSTNKGERRRPRHTGRAGSRLLTKCSQPLEVADL
jgi:hypothetical protein